ncbi:MAG: hypothetical protein QOG14_4555 [Mycobacterium sp.]|nr:hypothetical protein [Mycobacterium sp.]
MEAIETSVGTGVGGRPLPGAPTRSVRSDPKDKTYRIGKPRPPRSGIEWVHQTRIGGPTRRRRSECTQPRGGIHRCHRSYRDLAQLGHRPD